MSLTVLGILVFTVTLIILLSGMPLWAGLTISSMLFLAIFSPGALVAVPHILLGSMESFAILAIPLFILMAAPLGLSRASFDLYEGLHRFLHWLPGGLGIVNVMCCSVFSALCGSSPATAAAVGRVGIPQMRNRGYPAHLATGIICGGGTLGILIPPSVTFIAYGIATETSIGKLFIAGIMPGIMITVMFSLWVSFYYYFYVIKRQRRETLVTQPLDEETFTWRERFQQVPKLLPFILIIFLVLGALYGGWATPSEVAGVGAVLAFAFTAILYGTYRLSQLRLILGQGLRESTMILLIMAGSLLFGYVLSQLYISQALTEWLAGLEVNRWIIMFGINIILLVLGCFMPPVAIILIIAPILLPVVMALGFDPIWFGVIVTINMEMGCITPPVGLNLFVIRGIAPDIPLATVLKGSVPFLIMLAVSIVIVSFFPQIALWLPGMMR